MNELDPRQRERLSRLGSWPIVLGTLAAAVLVANAIAVPLILTLVLGGSSDLADVADIATTPAVLFLSVLVGDGALALAAYLLVVRRGILSWRQMGLTGGTRGHPVLRGFGWAVAFIIVSSAAAILLAGFGIEQDQSDQFPIQDMGTLGRVGIWIAGVIFAPVTEEVFFRGYVFQAMAARKGVARGVIFSSLLFSLLHLNLAAFLPVALGGAVLALSYHRGGDLRVPIIAHALNNAFSFSMLLLTT